MLVPGRPLRARLQDERRGDRGVVREPGRGGRAAAVHAAGPPCVGRVKLRRENNNKMTNKETTTEITAIIRNMQKKKGLPTSGGS